jgi:hypothetical protein
MERLQFLSRDQIKFAVSIAPFFFAEAALDDMPAPSRDADSRIVNFRKCGLIGHEHAG